MAWASYRPNPLAFGWRDRTQVQFAHLLVCGQARRAHHHVFGALVHREHDHVAHVRRIGQQHHNPVDPSGTATVGRRAVLERVDHPAKALSTSSLP